MGARLTPRRRHLQRRLARARRAARQLHPTRRSASGRHAPGGAHQLHPNFQAVTQKQAKHIYLCYHRGLKHNIQTGKAEYTPPVRLEQWCCDDFDWDRSIMIEVLRAGSLVDACLAACRRGAAQVRHGRQGASRRGAARAHALGEQVPHRHV
mmetsp:Transcript_28174/g.90593  ORF Transcript_28174/g.90593 Transcript_28174/m.90593 type:complete len:152 (+) Transcript_28174:3-458(+)